QTRITHTSHNHEKRDPHPPRLKSGRQLWWRHNVPPRPPRKKHRQQNPSLRSLRQQKRTLRKSSITSPKFSPVSATTTATEPRWVTPKNLGTAREVPFSGDPAYRRPAASRLPGPSISHPGRDDDALRAFRRRCSFVRAAQARQTVYSAGMIGMTVLE